MRSLIRGFARHLTIQCIMTVKLLTEHHLEFLSLKGGCTGSSHSSFALFLTLYKIVVYLIVLNRDLCAYSTYGVCFLLQWFG